MKVYLIEERRANEELWVPTVRGAPKLFMFAARRLLWQLRQSERENPTIGPRLLFRISRYDRREPKARAPRRSR